ncbi:MAG: tRNA (guanosine(46)-N7)-methyltransferase TrmB [Planctomycetota bacterium]|nr:MAG: tRNA (guanosine(46)-N7)-methyltransferase TrmB [Planctomycetota bacterium]
MGRRALRKIDPNLDLSYHLRTAEQLPQPWNPAALFGREAPLELEVGSGKGLFLRRAAAAFPDRDFLGIEVAFKYARFAAANLAKRELKNAIVVHGDALRIVAEYIPDASLHAVHVYFPDPWWKKRHRKRRVLKDTFVRDVERVLVSGGEFHFWTDVEEYFRESLEIIAAHTTLAGPFEVPEAQPEHDLDYRTHFERRMRLAGLPVYRSRFEKR